MLAVFVPKDRLWSVGMRRIGGDVSLQAIIVGGLSDDFVRRATDIPGRYGIESVLCDDVYSAVAKVGKGPGGVVIGRLGELGREDGRFFDIARAYGFACCCFVDKDAAGRRREILAAMERGALVVTELEELEGVLMKLSQSRDGCEAGERGGGGEGRGIGEVVEKILGGGGSGPSGVSKGSSFRKDDFVVTNDELDALLGA